MGQFYRLGGHLVNMGRRDQNVFYLWIQVFQGEYSRRPRTAKD